MTDRNDLADYEAAERIHAKVSAAVALLEARLAPEREARLSARRHLKHKALWLTSNTLAAACLYFGFVEGVDGARNVVVFWIWLGFAVSLFTMADAVRTVMRANGPAVPQWVDGTLDVAVVAFLAWHGAALLATAYIIHTLLIHAAYASTAPSTEAKA